MNYKVKYVIDSSKQDLQDMEGNIRYRITLRAKPYDDTAPVWLLVKSTHFQSGYVNKKTRSYIRPPCHSIKWLKIKKDSNPLLAHYDITKKDVKRATTVTHGSKNAARVLGSRYLKIHFNDEFKRKFQPMIRVESVRSFSPSKWDIK